MQLLGAADASRRGVGAPLPAAERGDVDRAMRAARDVLGDKAYQKAFDRGARMGSRVAMVHMRDLRTGAAELGIDGSEFASEPS